MGFAQPRCNPRSRNRSCGSLDGSCRHPRSAARRDFRTNAATCCLTPFAYHCVVTTLACRDATQPNSIPKLRTRPGEQPGTADRSTVRQPLKRVAEVVTDPHGSRSVVLVQHHHRAGVAPLPRGGLVRQRHPSVSASQQRLISSWARSPATAPSAPPTHSRRTVELACHFARCIGKVQPRTLQTPSTAPRTRRKRTSPFKANQHPPRTTPDPSTFTKDPKPSTRLR